MAITVKHKFVSAIPDSGDNTIVQPSNWNDTHDLVGTVPVANGGTGAATLTGYVKGNGTSNMTASTTIPNTDITGLGTASTKDAGVANGVATLDSSGTIPLSQIPPLGDLNYQGAWNATTNSPTLTSSVGTKGFYYVVSVAGTTNLNGITDWQVGDWAVFNGSVWQKIDNTDAVTSVNGYTGAVVLTQSDISGTVPTSRTISTGTGLTGGGDLSANRTISFSTASVGTWAATPSSANLAAAITDETGSGSLVFGTSPTISSPTISGGSINGANIGGSIAGDGTFDILTANVSRLGTSSATSYVASNGLSSTSTFSGSAPTDGIVIDYSTGYGRFSAFAGDGYQWYTGGIGTTKIMDLSSSGALVLTGTVTANGVVLTGNTGTVTSVAATAGTGISISGSPITTSGTLTITNTAPDQTVAISSGTGISVTGTYPNFTVTNTSPSSGGTVTSVSGTAPISVATGTTTPAISISQATTSTNGYLSSTDWNTFNNKQPAGAYLTAVTADAPLSGSGTSVSHLVISQANTSTNGYLSSTDWNTFNGKAPAVTYTTNYVPYGQGTTTPALSANFTFNGTNLTVGTAGVSSRIQGDFSNATVSTRTAFQTGTTNGSTGIYALPNGTSTAASWQATNAADPTNASKVLIATNGSTDVQLVSGINGTGTYLPLTFWNNGAEKMRLSVAGGLAIGSASDAGAGNLLVQNTITATKYVGISGGTF